MQFCKTLLGVKTSTQNNFIYGELWRINYQTRRYLIIIKYWLKVIQKTDNKYVNVMYKLMLRDIDSNARIINWVFLVRDLLYRLGFNDVWLFQGVGDDKVFFSIVKQRLHDQFFAKGGMKNWKSLHGLYSIGILQILNFKII